MTIIDEICQDNTLVMKIGEQNQSFLQNNSGKYLRANSRGMAEFSHTFILRENLLLDTVHWCQSHITLCRSSRDVISFRFSGCIMARYIMKGEIFVAHVHCDEDIEKDCRRDFAIFLKENASDITELQIFQPGASIWNHCTLEQDAPDGMVRCLWGVFTSDWRTYSLLVDWDTFNGKFYLREIVEHFSYGRRMSYYGDLQKFADCNENDFTDSVFDSLRDRLNNFWDSGLYEQTYRYSARSIGATEDRKGYRCPCSCLLI